MSEQLQTKLTKRQIDVAVFMRSFLAANDEMPPMRTISKHFGWSSDNAAQQHVNSLAEKGVLERNDIGNWRFVRAREVA